MGAKREHDVGPFEVKQIRCPSLLALQRPRQARMDHYNWSKSRRSCSRASTGSARMISTKEAKSDGSGIVLVGSMAAGMAKDFLVSS